MIMVPVKKRLRVVYMTAIDKYLGCKPGKLLTTFDHLIKDPIAIEIRPGQWITVTALTDPPPATKQGRLLVMTRRGRK
jgi:hypothetical protein